MHGHKCGDEPNRISPGRPDVVSTNSTSYSHFTIWEVATKSSWCGSGVVRSHPPMAVALASTGKEGLPLYHQTAVFYDRSHLRDARSTVKKLDRRVATMIQGHGATTVGKGAKDAAVNSIYVERDAYMQPMAYAAGYGKNVHEPLFHICGGLL